MSDGNETTLRSGEAIEVDDETYDELVRAAKGPILVDCWAAWCGPCRKTTPIIRALAKDYAETLTVAKLDTEANRYMAGVLELTGIPSFLLYIDGEEVDRLVGGIGREKFEEMLRRHKVI